MLAIFTTTHKPFNVVSRSDYHRKVKYRHRQDELPKKYIQIVDTAVCDLADDLGDRITTVSYLYSNSVCCFS